MEATRLIAEQLGQVRRAQVIEEIQELQRNSNWSKFVNASKVCNLTTNELNNHELELLSLGLDFKLQGASSSLIETFEGFERFNARYSCKPDKPDLRLAKKDTLLAIHTSKVDPLPWQYLKAIKTIKSNQNIKVTQSDKGKDVVCCYKRTYDCLLQSHFGDINLYQPVDRDDTSGCDIRSMAREFTDKLDKLIKESSDARAKKIVKDLMPPKSTKFPKGRVSLKVHKEGVSETHIPVRPIVSNTNSPTSNLASYLGKNLTNNLGIVSDKHIASTEQFAQTVGNCTTEGRMLSLDVVLLQI